MKITRNVGAGAHGALPADIKLVQQALAAIKPLGSLTGYYTGSIDGISGPLTIAAIESFQSANQIPVSGRIEPVSQTMRVLVDKTPKSLQFVLDKSGGGSAGAIGTGNVAKVLEYGGIVAAHAEENWALPANSAKDLAKSIKKLASDAIIPIMFNPPFPVSLDADGRFNLQLRISEWGYEKSADGLEDAKIMAENATQGIIMSGLWQRASGKALHIKTRDAIPELANLAPLEKIQLETLGLDSIPKDPVLAACAAAIAHNDCPVAKEFTRQLPKDIQDKQGKKLIEGVKSGNNFEKRRLRMEAFYDDSNLANTTVFPGAAAAVLNVMSVSFFSEQTEIKMEELSASLEKFNSEIFKKLMNGEFVKGITDSSDGVDRGFVRFEQSKVQIFLNKMKIENEELYRAVIKEANERFSSLLTEGSGPMSMAKARLGRAPNFDNQDDRIRIGYEYVRLEAAWRAARGLKINAQTLTGN